MKGAPGKEDARGIEGTCPSYSCAHLPESKLSIRGCREKSRARLKRARRGKRKASTSRIPLTARFARHSKWRACSQLFFPFPFKRLSRKLHLEEKGLISS